MKISYNWLKRYIDIDMDVKELGEMLTDSGLEVEGIEKFQSVKGGLEGIVIGEVISCDKHPNADRFQTLHHETILGTDIAGETSQ